MKLYNNLVNVKIIVFILILLTGCASNQNARQIDYNCFNKYSDKEVSLIDCYRLSVAFHVNKKYKFLPVTKCDEYDITSIVISIKPDGELKEIKYIERSKCEGLDESAFMAIKNANPFNPFPNELKDDLVELGLRFTPKGIK